MTYIDVRDPTTNKLLFRYDPVRRLVQIKQDRVIALVDLAQYDPQPPMLVVITPETLKSLQGTIQTPENVLP